MVIPERVVDLLACWIGVLGDIALLMYGGPFLYVLCGPSRERGTSAPLRGCAFVFELKLFLFRSLYDWMVALSSHSFSCLEEFLDLCKL